MGLDYKDEKGCTVVLRLSSNQIHLYLVQIKRRYTQKAENKIVQNQCKFGLVLRKMHTSKERDGRRFVP